MRAARLLVTGFGPFPRVPRNPSAVLAARVACAPSLRHRTPDLLILPTTYAALDTVLAPALARRPAAVLMFGVAARTRRVRIEALARNRVTTLFPDAAGVRPPARTLVPGAPAARRSALARRMVSLLAHHGLRADLSRDAGAYLCNAAYFRVLADGIPAVFVHVPPPPQPGRKGTRRRTVRSPAAIAARAYAAVATELLRSRPCRQRGAPASVGRSIERR